ncbi:MAG: HypC/HybG/HupF family hydrogenase formation chaperone [Gemmataceae bacterium]
MCLGIPGRIVEVASSLSDQLETATVAFGGLKRPICVALVPDLRPGDYVLVHAGIAIEKIDEKQAAEMLAYLQAISDGELSELTQGEMSP